MSKSKTVPIKLLNKEFQVNCPEGAEDQLVEAAHYLDVKMRDIRNTGRVIDSERIAIMAALNIAHELLSSRQHKETYSEHVTRQIQRLQKKLDEVLMEDTQSSTGNETF